MKKLLYFSLFILSSSFAFGQTWLWGTEGTSKSGNGVGEGYGVAADRLGNAYGCGSFMDTIGIGSYTLKASGAYSSAYLVKYSSTGSVLWAAQSANTNNTGASSVATDKVNNVYITGAYRGDAAFGPFTLLSTSGTHSLLVKYAASGVVLWAEPSVNGNAVANGVCTDGKDNAIITGRFAGTVSFGTLILTSTGMSAFVVKYDSAGTPVWAEQSNNTYSLSNAAGSCITTDVKNNVYVGGGFADSVRFGTDTLATISNAQYGTMFVAKYSSSGTLRWVRQATVYNLSDIAGPGGIAVDKYSNSYLIGTFQDSASFGPIKLVASGANYAIFIVKYDSLGNVKWAKTAACLSSSVWSGYGIAIDTNGNLYTVMGGTGPNVFQVIYDTTDFYTSFSGGDGASLVMKLDTAGHLKCGSIINGGGDDQNAIACDPSGRYIYLGGDFWSTAVFGLDTLTLVGNEVPFMSSWEPCYPDTVTTGTTELITKSEEVQVYPNPSNGVFTIVLSNPELVSAFRTISIYTIFGQKVNIETLKQVQGDNLIDISELPNGIYFYRVLDEGGGLIGEGKLILQK